MKKRFLILFLFIFLLGSLTACDGLGSKKVDNPGEPIDNPDNPNNPDDPSDPKVSAFNQIKGLFTKPYNFTYNASVVCTVDGGDPMESSQTQKFTEKWIDAENGTILIKLENGVAKSIVALEDGSYYEYTFAEYAEKMGVSEEQIKGAYDINVDDMAPVVFRKFNAEDFDYANGMFTLKDPSRLGTVIPTYGKSVQFTELKVCNSENGLQAFYGYKLDGVTYSFTYTFYDFNRTVIIDPVISERVVFKDLTFAEIKELFIRPYNFSYNAIAIATIDGDNAQESSQTQRVAGNVVDCGNNLFLMMDDAYNVQSVVSKEATKEGYEYYNYNQQEFSVAFPDYPDAVTSELFSMNLQHSLPLLFLKFKDEDVTLVDGKYQLNDLSLLNGEVSAMPGTIPDILDCYVLYSPNGLSFYVSYSYEFNGSTYKFDMIYQYFDINTTIIDEPFALSLEKLQDIFTKAGYNAQIGRIPQIYESIDEYRILVLIKDSEVYCISSMEVEGTTTPWRNYHVEGDSEEVEEILDSIPECEFDKKNFQYTVKEIQGMFTNPFNFSCVGEGSLVYGGVTYNQSSPIKVTNECMQINETRYAMLNKGEIMYFVYALGDDVYQRVTFEDLAEQSAMSVEQVKETFGTPVSETIPLVILKLNANDFYLGRDGKYYLEDCNKAYNQMQSIVANLTDVELFTVEVTDEGLIVRVKYEYTQSSDSINVDVTYTITDIGTTTIDLPFVQTIEDLKDAFEQAGYVCELHYSDPDNDGSKYKELYVSGLMSIAHIYNYRLQDKYNYNCFGVSTLYQEYLDIMKELTYRFANDPLSIEDILDRFENPVNVTLYISGASWSSLDDFTEAEDYQREYKVIRDWALGGTTFNRLDENYGIKYCIQCDSDFNPLRKYTGADYDTNTSLLPQDYYAHSFACNWELNVPLLLTKLDPEDFEFNSKTDRWVLKASSFEKAHEILQSNPVEDLSLTLNEYYLYDANGSVYVCYDYDWNAKGVTVNYVCNAYLGYINKTSFTAPFILTYEGVIDAFSKAGYEVTVLPIPRLVGGKLDFVMEFDKGDNYLVLITDVLDEYNQIDGWSYDSNDQDAIDLLLTFQYNE